MYAIIREGDGKFYTSMVFGFYKSSDEYDYKKRFWIILNKEKTELIKQHALQQNTKYLIPMVLITDADQTNWNQVSENEESVDFLPTSELLSLIDNHAVPEELVQKCIEMDNAYRFESIRTVTTSEDIRDLDWVSGGFHDAYISEIKEGEQQLCILFDGTWGCKIKVWFDGEVAYDVSSRDPELHDPCWFGSTIMIQGGFVYLVDDEDVSVEEITSGYCWFRARNMKYRVIPD